MSNYQKEVKGVIPALITPFTQGDAIDMDGLVYQLEYLSGSGVNGFFIGGTTGEGAYLSTAEKQQLINTAQQVSNGRQAICAVCIQPSTAAVLSEMRILLKTNPDYIAAVPPFYYSMTPKAIVEHYITIADASPVPVILYDIPQRTHNPIPPEILQELSQHSNIIGIKDSTGDFVRFSRMLGNHLVDESFIWMQGNDYLSAVSFMIGADAVVSGLSNVFPTPYVRLFDAYMHHDVTTMLAEQRKIQELAHIIYAAGGNDITAVKAALEHLGRCSRRLRVTALSASDKVVLEVGKIVDELVQFYK